MYYFLMTVAKDEKAQKHGYVLCVYGMGQGRHHDKGHRTDAFYTARLLPNLPMRCVSFHLCYDHPLIKLTLKTLLREVTRLTKPDHVLQSAENKSEADK